MFAGPAIGNLIEVLGPGRCVPDLPIVAFVYATAAPGITRPLAYLQTIEVAQRKSRAPTGETLLAGQSPSPQNRTRHHMHESREIWLHRPPTASFWVPAPRSRGRSSPC